MWLFAKDPAHRLGQHHAFGVARFLPLALLLAAGCATTPAVVQAPAPPLEDPGPLAERWRLPSRILDGRTGAELSEAQLRERLAAARVVYVGEKHDRPHDHAVQLQVLDMLVQLEPSVGLGLEMFKRPFQKWVSDYVAGRIDEAKMLERTQWSKRWGFDIALYRPILEYARQHKLPTYALNARDEITRKVAREGLEALDPVDRETVPELVLDDAAHREEIREVFDAHGMGHGKMTFENFYTAQVIWDETMAHEVAAELTKDGAPERIVVLAGGGHIRRGLGIPQRAARRGAKPWVSVYPVMAQGDPEVVEELLKEKVADILWVMLPPEAPVAAGDDPS